MKKKIFLAFFMLLPLVANAKYYNDIYQAQKEALKEAKLMLFIIVSHRCKYCHKLLDDIANNPQLIQLLDEKFVVTITDLEEPTARIPSNVGFRGKTPSTIILTPTGKIIGKQIEGAISSHDLYVLLNSFEEYKQTQLGF